MDIRIALFLSLTAIAACTTQAPLAATEIFDERSAATLLVAAKPLVFARERSDVAAHSRDYATLLAVEDDRSGKYSQYLLLYRWSTVDPRMSPEPDADAGQLRILADGRSIDLTPLEQMPVSLARRHELHLPEHGNVVPHAYPVDDALLQFIATSRELTVQMPQEALQTPFALRHDGRPALREFLKSEGST
jgi:hypothetical protein